MKILSTVMNDFMTVFFCRAMFHISNSVRKGRNSGKLFFPYTVGRRNVKSRKNSNSKAAFHKEKCGFRRIAIMDPRRSERILDKGNKRFGFSWTAGSFRKNDRLFFQILDCDGIIGRQGKLLSGKNKIFTLQKREKDSIILRNGVFRICEDKIHIFLA